MRAAMMPFISSSTGMVRNSVRHRGFGNLKDAGDDGWSIGMQEHPHFLQAMRTVIRAERVFPAPEKAGT